MSSLIRWNPVALSRTFDQLFNEFAALDTSRPMTAPALDIVDQENHLELRFNMPGVAPENVNIEVQKGVLTVSTSVNSDDTHESGRYTYRERYQGSYQRSLRLPDYVDAQHTEATFENGVLVIKLAKTPAAQPLRIPVKNSPKVISSGE